MTDKIKIKMAVMNNSTKEKPARRFRAGWDGLGAAWGNFTKKVYAFIGWIEIFL